MGIISTAYPKTLMMILVPVTKFGFPKELNKTALPFGPNVVIPVTVVDLPHVRATILTLSALLKPMTNALNAMMKKNQDCTTFNISKKCNLNNSWSQSQNKFCQLSCYNAGLGYEGDIYCNSNSRKNLRH